MAIIFDGSSCSICNKALNQNDNIVVFPAFLQPDHMLWRYSDSGMHEECFNNWEFKVEFEQLLNEYFRHFNESRKLEFKDILTSDILRNAPEYIIGEKRLSNLEAYLNGITHTINFLEIELDKEIFPYVEFTEWIIDHYNLPEFDYRWKKIILDHYNGDEEKALVEFFELYDLFLKEKYSGV